MNDLNDFTTGVSIFNNYSLLLNNMIGKDNKESIGSVILMATNVIDLAAKSKIVKFVNNGAQSGVLADKLWDDIKKFNAQMYKKMAM